MPRVEPIRAGGPNKPYQALGRDYVPMTRDAAWTERGLASWYGRKFNGLPTASGETYDMYAMTAAHPTLPIPSYARITNPANGRSVIVRINDRGPFHAGRIVDLSYAAAARLDLLRGVAPVELERITFEAIRVGSWRRPGDGDAVVAAASPAASSITPPVAASFAASSIEAAPPPTIDIATPAPIEAATAPRPAGDAPRGFWVQLGAFRDGAGAALFQRRVAVDLEAYAPTLATFADASYFRVQSGPYAGRDEADRAAQRIREAIGLVPMVVERK